MIMCLGLFTGARYISFFFFKQKFFFKELYDRLSSDLIQTLVFSVKYSSNLWLSPLMSSNNDVFSAFLPKQKKQRLWFLFLTGRTKEKQTANNSLYVSGIPY